MNYNIYYKNQKINSSVLNEEELNNVLKHNVIYKKSKYIENKLTEIPTNELKVVKCVKI